MTPPVEAVLRAIEDESREIGFTLSSEAETGKLLCALAASKPAGRLLELGTGTGYGAAWLLHGMDAGARLISIDRDERVQAVARKHLGRDARCRFLARNVADWLRQAQPQTFDLIFADAWPGKLSHFDEAIELLRPGGIYVVDDLTPQVSWDPGHRRAVEDFTRRLESDARLRTVRLDDATGVAIGSRRA